MQIIINQKEIEKAIKLYLSSNVMVRSLNDVRIEFITTRSGEGVKATIDIDNSPSSLVQDEDLPKPTSTKFMYDNGGKDINIEEGKDVNIEVENEVTTTSQEPEAEQTEVEQQFKRESMFAGLKKTK